MTRWAEEAVALSDRWPCPPVERGTVYGLRAEARELVGSLDPALDDHFQALELFREAARACWDLGFSSVLDCDSSFEWTDSF